MLVVGTLEIVSAGPTGTEISVTPRIYCFNLAFAFLPQFNFVGKILGPQGNTIKRLQEETGAKISVLGKGSMRDKAKVTTRAPGSGVHGYSQ